ncbi:COMM domain-containing protein 1-like isoform X3 [Tyto alba]|uniref:COMM domain-containing protein 1-like isoform X3 n=1 Tax=Tyto alba TaxID=56313 RepID=UPI001C67BD1F|nr:COMM domain-containing protein 1-like isoform X3 [Tyto alba]
MHVSPADAQLSAALNDRIIKFGVTRCSRQHRTVPRNYAVPTSLLAAASLCVDQSIASADMDLNQLEAFLTAQTKKQGGITSDQAAVIAKFWKNHRIKIHESLINQSRWDNVLKNMNWRVDLKSQSRHVDQINTPVAIVEMELGKNGQAAELRLRVENLYWKDNSYCNSEGQVAGTTCNPGSNPNSTDSSTCTEETP